MDDEDDVMVESWWIFPGWNQEVHRADGEVLAEHRSRSEQLTERQVYGGPRQPWKAMPQETALDFLEHMWFFAFLKQKRLTNNLHVRPISQSTQSCGWDWEIQRCCHGEVFGATHLKLWASIFPLKDKGVTGIHFSIVRSQVSDGRSARRTLWVLAMKPFGDLVSNIG